MPTTEHWKFYVYDERLLCPLRLEEVDVGECTACEHLRAVEVAEDGTGVVCVAPPGDSARQRLEALLR
jgi:hypothetical protein